MDLVSVLHLDDVGHPITFEMGALGDSMHVLAKLKSVVAHVVDEQLAPIPLSKHGSTRSIGPNDFAASCYFDTRACIASSAERRRVRWW
jgi:hypothetical protein